MFKFLPSKVQVGLFSATMPTEVLEITKHFMRDPVRCAPPLTPHRGSTAASALLSLSDCGRADADGAVSRAGSSLRRTS